MKRFLVFVGDDYYPCGGFWDFQIASNTLQSAYQWAKENVYRNQWCHIVDLEKGEIVVRNGKGSRWSRTWQHKDENGEWVDE